MSSVEILFFYGVFLCFFWKGYKMESIFFFVLSFPPSSFPYGLILFVYVYIYIYIVKWRKSGVFLIFLGGENNDERGGCLKEGRKGLSRFGIMEV